MLLMATKSSSICTVNVVVLGNFSYLMRDSYIRRTTLDVKFNVNFFSLSKAHFLHHKNSETQNLNFVFIAN